MNKNINIRWDLIIRAKLKDYDLNIFKKYFTRMLYYAEIQIKLDNLIKYRIFQKLRIKNI